MKKKMPFGIILWKLWDPGCKNLVESKIGEGYIEKIGSTWVAGQPIVALAAVSEQPCPPVDLAPDP